MDSPYLTKRQLETYDFLVIFYRSERRWPTYRETQAGLGWKSTNSVFNIYGKLVDKGYLKKTGNGYEFTNKVPGKTDLPDAVLEHSTQESEMDSPYLTKRQLDTYDFLVNFYRSERRWPTYRETQAVPGWKSTNSVFNIYGQLVDKGYLKKTGNGYEFTNKVPGKTDLPDAVLEHSTQESEEV